MSDKIIKRHSFIINPKDNGGEQVIITTDFISNGEGIYTSQEISLQSYCNSASIKLLGAQITPEILTNLAYQLLQTQFEAEVLHRNRKK